MYAKCRKRRLICGEQIKRKGVSRPFFMLFIFLLFFAANDLIPLSTAVLTHALIVGNTFRLRRAGLLGSQHQKDHRDDVRKHRPQIGADAFEFLELRHERDAGRIRADDLEQRKEQGRAEDGPRFPVTEDHNRQRKEAVNTPRLRQL